MLQLYRHVAPVMSLQISHMLKLKELCKVSSEQATLKQRLSVKIYKAVANSLNTSVTIIDLICNCKVHGTTTNRPCLVAPCKNSQCALRLMRKQVREKPIVKTT